MILSSSCIANEAQPSSLGEYEMICKTKDNFNIYGHLDSNTISYLYHQTSEEKWLVSSKIGDPVAAMGISSVQICPEDMKNDISQYQPILMRRHENIPNNFLE